MFTSSETLEPIMHELETLGTEQNRKTYRRHGVAGEQFGVSYSNLRRIAKRIKQNQPLAESLWSTGNHDARVLATMIADPPQMTSRIMDAWAHELDNNVLADALSALCAQSPLAERQMAGWCVSRNEWIASTGWNMAAHLAMSDASLPDEKFDEKFLGILETIEEEIHKAPNHVRHTMNGALIAIGLRNAKLEKAAIDAARRIGRVEVDHGDTACTTPDAIAYIQKAVARRQGKAAGADSKRAPRRSANGKSPQAATSSKRTKPAKKATPTKTASKKKAAPAKKSSAKKTKKSPAKAAANRKVQRAVAGSPKGTKKKPRATKATAKRS